MKIKILFFLILMISLVLITSTFSIALICDTGDINYSTTTTSTTNIYNNTVWNETSNNVTTINSGSFLVVGTNITTTDLFATLIYIGGIEINDIYLALANIATAIDNTTIVRTYNTSWITDNQAFNTSVDIAQAVIDEYPNLDTDSSDDLSIANLDNDTIIRSYNESWVVKVLENSTIVRTYDILGNTTDEIRRQFIGSDNITINYSTGAISINVSNLGRDGVGILNNTYAQLADLNVTGTLNVTGNAYFAEELYVSDDIYVTNRIYHYGDSALNTLMSFGENRIRFLIDSNYIIEMLTDRLNITAPKIEFAGTVITNFSDIDSNETANVDLIIGTYITGNITQLTNDIENSTIVRSYNTSWIRNNQNQNETANIVLIRDTWIPNNVTQLTNEIENSTIIRTNNRTWKVNNASFADDSALLDGQPASHYLDNQNITNCSGANCDIGWGNLTSIPALLDLDSSDDITTSGGTIDGNLNINGNLTLIGDTFIANVTTQNLNGSLLPQITNFFDIGSPAFIWNEIYATTFIGQLDWDNLTNIGKVGNTTEEIFTVVNNGTFLDNSDQRYNDSNINTTDNLEGLGFNITTELKDYFDTLYNWWVWDAINHTGVDNITSVDDLINNETTRVDLIIGTYIPDNVTQLNTNIINNYTLLNNNNIDTNDTAMHLNQDNWYGDGWITYTSPNFVFNESKLSTVYYNATKYSLIAGTIAGTIEDIHHSDGNYDGVTLNITESAGSPGLDVRINFTNIEDFNAGVMRYRTSTLAGDYPIIQLWSDTSNEWEDYPAVSESIAFATIEQPVFDSTGHINNSVVQMRIYKSPNGNINNKYYIDWIAITKGYGTPAGEEVDPVWSADKSNYYNSSQIENSTIIRDYNISWLANSLDNLTILRDYNLGNYANISDLISNETTRVNLIIGTYIPNNYTAATAYTDTHETTFKHGNTTAEIRQQFTGSDNISIDSGVISINKSFTNWDTDNTDDITTSGGAITGNLVINGNLTLIGDTFEANVTQQNLNGSFYPHITNFFDIGSSSLTWNEIYATTFYGQIDWANLTNVPQIGNTTTEIAGVKVNNATFADDSALLDGMPPSHYLDNQNITNCSGANCDIGWGNLTSVPSDIADGDDDTTYEFLSEFTDDITDNTTIIRSYNTSWKVDNSSFADDSALLDGQLGSYYLDNQNISNETVRMDALLAVNINLTNTSWVWKVIDNSTFARLTGFSGENITSGLINESYIDTDITRDSELEYIGNCSGANCDIGWGNLTSIPSDIADGDDYEADTTIANETARVNLIIGTYILTNVTSLNVNINNNYTQFLLDLNNATIIRDYNTSWITDNQLFNTSTDIKNAIDTEYPDLDTDGTDDLLDSDFGSAGLMKTDGAGTYSIITDSSINWNYAYTWLNNNATNWDRTYTAWNANGTNWDIETIGILNNTYARLSTLNVTGQANLIEINITSADGSGTGAIYHNGSHLILEG